MSNNDYITTTELHTARGTTTDTLSAVVITILLSPLLAAPLGLAWRVLTWAAGI